MFSSTFLGHQGWLISGAGTRVLVDPLPTPNFGHGGHLGQVYPPRTFDFSALPAIDGVILTHEHDDHFDVASLARIHREIPLFLSSRSSAAARDLLETMGFAHVGALAPDTTLELGGLQVHARTTDHSDGRQADEWDTVPWFIHDADGHGGMLCSVDVRFRARDLASFAALGVGPGLWVYANNCSHAGFQTVHTSPPSSAEHSDDSPAVAGHLARRHDALTQAWRAPALTLICGAGWTLPAERSGLNHHLFPADHAAVLAALAQTHPALPVRVPLPGQAVTMVQGQVVSTHADQPFLSTPDPSLWPARDYRGLGATLREYAPACGRTELSGPARQTLLDELVDLARFMYGRPLFAAIHGLPRLLPSGHQASVCLLLRDDAEPLTLRYDPSQCAFELSPERDPIASFASGLECWASDLHALLTGEIGASALCYAGRMRAWNHAPRLLRVSPALLWHYANPLRRPDRAARLYAALLAREAGAPVEVHPR